MIYKNMYKSILICINIIIHMKVNHAIMSSWKSCQIKLVYTNEKTSPLTNYLIRITFSILFICKAIFP